MVTSQEGADGRVSSNEFRWKQSFESENGGSQQIPDENIHTHTPKGINTTSTKIEEAVRESDAAVSRSQLHREKNNFEKTLKTPESSLLSLQSSMEGSFEKVPEDGYNWRKYGQKQVRGNEFIKSYYRCSSPNCPAKKQLERSHDGQITDTMYFGQHDHLKTHPDIPNAVSFDVTMVKETPNMPSSKIGGQPTVEQGHTPSRVSSNDHVKGIHSGSIRLLKDKARKDRGPKPKRWKKEEGYTDPSPMEKLTGEPRVVVQTRSEVDIVNDGYRWRKYGQKLVKGNANPRSYYRCSSPLCPAKKHVERASYDAKVVITTYEEQHNHDLPPTRTVTHSVGANVNAITDQAESREKSISNAVELSTSENTSLQLDVRSEIQRSCENKTGSEVGDVVIHPAEDSETRPLEQEKQNGNSESIPQECDSVGTDGKVHSSTTNENVNCGDRRTQ